MKARILKKFEDEIQQLDRELKTELPKEIKRARELGDLRENAEYQAAKERQRLVEARISMLQKRVSEISLMNLDRIPHDRVGFGSTVHLKEADGSADDLSARHARGRRCGARDDLDGLADRPRPSQQGRRGRGTRHDPEREPSIRSREAGDDPRRGRSNRSTINVITPDTPDRVYSTRLRTALVLTGSGTSAAYHAGVLRALHEAGVKLDLVAGRGIGVVGALFAAVDGSARLWEADGIWKAAGASAVLRLARAAPRRRVGAGGCRRHPRRPGRSAGVSPSSSPSSVFC